MAEEAASGDPSMILDIMVTMVISHLMLVMVDTAAMEVDMVVVVSVPVQ